MLIKPFFINSNICLDDKDIRSFDRFMKVIAGNTGNSYITYSLIKELGVDSENVRHIQNIYEYDFTKSEKDIEYINSECTHVFLILQDQIRLSESYGLQLPYQSIMNFISRLNKPVVICGLGANSFNGFDPNFYKLLKPELVKFLKFLSDHCINIGVRGEFTADVLNNLGIKNVTVVGCPSYFETGPNRILSKQEKIYLDEILLTGRFCIPQIYNNHTIMQDFQEEDAFRAVAFNDWSLVNNINEFNKLCSHKYHVFSDIESWKKFVSQFPFAIGYRLHGSIACLNSGVVSMCCNKDSRAREMSTFLHIPYNADVNESTDVMKLYESIDVDDINKSYPKLYKNFEDFIYKSTGIKIHKNKSIIKQPHIELYSVPTSCCGKMSEWTDYYKTLIQNGFDSELAKVGQKIEDIKQQNIVVDSRIDGTIQLFQNYIEGQRKKSKNAWYKKLFSVNKTKHHRFVRILGAKFNIGRIKHVKK